MAKLTSREVEWAVGLLLLDDTTVSAIARRLGVNRHTCAETSIDITKSKNSGGDVENPWPAPSP